MQWTSHQGGISVKGFRISSCGFHYVVHVETRMCKKGQLTGRRQAETQQRLCKDKKWNGKN